MQISSQQVSNDDAIIEQATLELVRGLEALLKKDGVPEHAWFLTPEKTPSTAWREWGFSTSDFEDTKKYAGKPEELVRKTFYSFDIIRAAYEIAKNLADHEIILSRSYPGITNARALNTAALDKADKLGLRRLWYLLYYLDSLTKAWVPLHIYCERSYAVACLLEAFYEKISQLKFPLKEAFLGGDLPITKKVAGVGVEFSIPFGQPRLPKLKAATHGFKTDFQGTERAAACEQLAEAQKPDFLAKVQTKKGAEKSSDSADAITSSDKEDEPSSENSKESKKPNVLAELTSPKVIWAEYKKQSDICAAAQQDIKNLRQRKKLIKDQIQAGLYKDREKYKALASELGCTEEEIAYLGHHNRRGATFRYYTSSPNTSFLLEKIDGKIDSQVKAIDAATVRIIDIETAVRAVPIVDKTNFQQLLTTWGDDSRSWGSRPVAFAGSKSRGWGGFKQWASEVFRNVINRWRWGSSAEKPVTEICIDDMVAELRSLLANAQPAKDSSKEGEATSSAQVDATTLRDLGDKVFALVHKLESAQETVTDSHRVKAIDKLIASAQEFLQWVALKQTCSGEKPSKPFLQAAGLAPTVTVSSALSQVVKADNGNKVSLQGSEVCMLDGVEKSKVDFHLRSKFPKDSIQLVEGCRLDKIGAELKYKAKNKNAVCEVEQVLTELSDTGVVSYHKNQDGSYTIEMCDLEKLQACKGQSFDDVSSKAILAFTETAQSIRQSIEGHAYRMQP